MQHNALQQNRPRRAQCECGFRGFFTVEITNYDGFVDCYAIPHLCTHKCEIWHETMNAKLESLLST